MACPKLADRLEFDTIPFPKNEAGISEIIIKFMLWCWEVLKAAKAPVLSFKASTEKNEIRAKANKKTISKSIFSESGKSF